MGIKDSKSNNKNKISEINPIDKAYEELSLSDENDRSVGIVGAGLAGCLLALLLSKLGFKVFIFEKRSDPRKDDENVDSEFGASKSASKRSINLALSHRGMLGLRELGLLDEIMEQAIRMPCRVIHSINKSEIKQPYGKDDEAIWSVSRQALNSLLLNKMSDSSNNINIFFGYNLISSDKNGNCVFNHVESGVSVSYDFDLIVGADGAYSSVRDNMLKQGRISFNRQYIDHGYKELSIPALETIDSSNGLKQYSYALSSFQGLHIWPRGRFMLIALPNPDKSFTATLFAPYKGEDGFDSIDNNNENSVINYFIKYFPDVYKLMPNLYNDYKTNPVGSLVTIRTNPWNFGKIVLIGDAAHAVVPFYGQGMNSAFEDGYILYNIIKSKLQDIGNNNNNNNGDNNSVESINFISCIEEFNNHRMPSTNCLADLCLEHYHDMASNTSSTLYLVRKKVELLINNIFPNLFTPIYSMVTFSNIPYNKAVEIADYQDKVLNMIMLSTVVCLSSLGVALTAYSLNNTHNNNN